MQHTDFSKFSATMGLALLTGCAGGALSAPSDTGANVSSATHGILPEAASEAATTSSPSSCSVTATATAHGPGLEKVLQASPISSSDMWFEELSYPANMLYVERYKPGAPSPTVLQPFSRPVNDAYLKAFADNDIWVAANPQATFDMFLAHWNGSSWQQISLAGPYATSFAPSGLSGLSTSDVWISGNVIIGSTAKFGLAHWNGTTLSLVGISPYGEYAGPLLELSPTDVWTITYGRYSDVVAAQWHGSGFAFHVLPAPPGQTNANAVPEQIAATGPKNIWVVGARATNTTIYGRIWRYNGSWLSYPYSSSGNANFQGVAPLDSVRAVITAGNSSNATTTYAYTGTGPFHAIPNNLPSAPTGPDAIVPGTTSFWEPTTQTSSTVAIVDLVSCR